ncbi:MAG: hypothetical protein Q4G14_12795 [Paracoccus sp. (in: a-proteobacteria)]|uniref:hypothetical protein n=1 Tax=Paracoccus sp. TaxID=267 RepID=UPI0026DF9491|nr:hypothetical protein [Paracoccus sp. (in: a-proteobacteria)]MDO5614102.1 hypothetical protein [Paracoccus sp. (in: a-proteobacteria)]
MTQRPLHFCIIERDLFIASDMRAGLELASPGCHVHHLRDMDEVNGSTPENGTIFITKLALADLDPSGLHALAQRVQGRIVLRDGTDSEDAVIGQGHDRLPSPFSNRDLRELVERLHNGGAE